MKVQLSVICDGCGKASIDIPFEVLPEGRIRITQRGEDVLRMIGWEMITVGGAGIQIEDVYVCAECARGKKA